MRMPDTDRKVKIFVLDDENQWDERAEGFVYFCFLNKFLSSALLIVEPRTRKSILESKINKDSAYNRIKRTITWLEDAYGLLAIHFENETDCDVIWELICKAQSKDPWAYLTQGEDTSVEAPEAEDPSAEVLKSEGSSAEVPKSEDSSAEVPKSEDSSAEVPKSEDFSAELTRVGEELSESANEQDGGFVSLISTADLEVGESSDFAITIENRTEDEIMDHNQIANPSDCTDVA